jgi:hypothetical protein
MNLFEHQESVLSSEDERRGDIKAFEKYSFTESYSDASFLPETKVDLELRKLLDLLLEDLFF